MFLFNKILKVTLKSVHLRNIVLFKFPYLIKIQRVVNLEILL